MAQGIDSVTTLSSRRFHQCSVGDQLEGATIDHSAELHRRVESSVILGN